MSNLKANLDNIILELCAASQDHDAQLAEKDQRIAHLEEWVKTDNQLLETATAKLADLEGWVRVEKALRLEAVQRIKELTEQNKHLELSLTESYEQRGALSSALVTLEEENKKLQEAEELSERRKEDVIRYAKSIREVREENEKLRVESRVAYKQWEQLRKENEALLASLKFFGLRP